MPGCVHKLQEYKQLLPPILPRAPLAASHCLILHSETCTKTGLCSQHQVPQPQTLHQTRCLSRSFVESYQHKIKSTDVINQCVYIYLTEVPTVQKKKAAKCQTFWQNKKTFAVFSAPSLNVCLSKSSLARKRIFKFKKKQSPQWSGWQLGPTAGITSTKLRG